MSYDMTVESVPSFRKRVGDHVIEGSNNSVIVLGRDRAAPGKADVSSGLGSSDSDNKGRSSGAIHMIAGLKDSEGNPDFQKDDSFVYLSMNSEPDKNLETNMEGDIGKTPSAIVKSDAIRMVARKDVKIVFDGEQSYIHLNKESCTIKIQGAGFIKIQKGKIVVDGDRVELGAGAVEHLMKGDSFLQLYNLHSHPSAVGPTGPPVVLMNPQLHLSSREILVL